MQTWLILANVIYFRYVVSYISQNTQYENVSMKLGSDEPSIFQFVYPEMKDSYCVCFLLVRGLTRFANVNHYIEHIYM